VSLDSSIHGPQRIPLLVLVLVTAVAAGCGEQSASASSQPLVFTVNDNGWGEIWLMDESGHARKQLTASRPEGTDAAGNTGPSWSPDGTQIAYTGTGDAAIEDPAFEDIYVMEGDGGHVERLTENDVPDFSPDWSPDGKQIVFSRGTALSAESPSAALYVMDADGSDQHELYRAKGVLLLTPDWSPDGKQIAFTRVSFPNGLPKASVYVMSSDGAGAKEVIPDAAEPDWSPDGEHIAFSSGRDKNGQTCFEECQPSDEIYVADADGTNSRRLTSEKAQDSSPSWSPDATQIAFVSDISSPGNRANEIYVVDVTGGEARRLTKNSVWDLEPDWK
jgi:TolB protein